MKVYCCDCFLLSVDKKMPLDLDNGVLCFAEGNLQYSYYSWYKEDFKKAYCCNKPPEEINRNNDCKWFIKKKKGIKK